MMSTNEHHTIIRISIKPAIHFGKPCVSGTRITVNDVLELIDAGIAAETIINEYYPDLSIEDIHACVQYANRIR